MRKSILLIILCILCAQLVLAETIDISIYENEVLNISEEINIFDPDGDPLELSFEEPLDENGVWETSYGDAGVYYTDITVSDGKSETVQTVKITVKSSNKEPVIKSVSPSSSDLTINEGASINFEVAASDPDEDKLYYSWKVDKKELSAKSSFKYKTDYESEGAHSVKLTVSDGDLKTTKAWDINVLHTNAPPSFEDMEDVEVNELDIVEIIPKAFDIDGDEISYTMSEPVGDDGIWETNFDDAGIYYVDITASDGELETTKTVKVVVNKNDRIPVFTYYTPEEKRVNIKEGEEIIFEVRAVDPDKDKLIYSWTHNNKDISDERRFRFKAGYNYAGAHTVEAFVSDGAVSISREWVVIIEDVNRAPFLGKFEDIIVEESETVVIEPDASDPDGDNIKITFSKPADEDGVWETSFDDAGTYYITVTVSDGELSVFKIVNVIVENKDRPAVFEKMSPIIVDEGSEINFKLSVYDPDEEGIKVTVSDLPEGAVFEDNTFIWTPGYDVAKRNTNLFGRILRNLYLYDLFYKDRKKFSVLFTAESGNSTVIQELKIVVDNVNRAPVLSDVSDITVAESELVKLNLSATDPDSDFVKISFSKPLNSRGEWFTDFDDAGVYNSSVSARDGDLVVTKRFKITVEETNRVPIIHFSDKIKTEEGKTINLEPRVTDLDGDNVIFNYSGWMDSAEYTTNENDSGIHTVTITASDGKDLATKDVTIFVKDTAEEEKSALWFYVKYVLLGIIILIVLIVLLNLKDMKRKPKKVKEIKKEVKEKPKRGFLWFGREKEEKVKEVKKEGKEPKKGFLWFGRKDKEEVKEAKKEAKIKAEKKVEEEKKEKGFLWFGRKDKEKVKEAEKKAEEIKKKRGFLWFGRGEKEEVKEAKKEVKVEKKIEEIKVEEEEIEEPKEPLKIQWKKWIGAVLVVILLLALVAGNYYLLKPSAKVKFADVDDQKISESETIEIPLEMKNADSYSVDGLPEGAKIEHNTIIWTPNFKQSGSYDIRACAFNNISSDCIEFTIAVENTNIAPEIVDFRPPERIMSYVDKAVVFFVNASDEDGDALKYVWKLDGLFGEKIESSHNVLKVVFRSVGKKTLVVKVLDGEDSVEQKWVIDVIKRPSKTRLAPKMVSYVLWDVDDDTISYVIDDSSSEVIELVVEDTEKTYILGEEDGIEVVSEEELEFVL